MALVKSNKRFDIRFVFMNAKNKIYKGSKTTYATGVLDMIFSGQRKQYRWSGLKMAKDK